MTDNTPAPAPVAWDSLFDAAETEPVQRKDARPAWTGEIPEKLAALVKRAAADGERVVLPCPNLEAYDTVVAMATAAAAKLDPPKVVYARARHDSDSGNVTHVTFTVGEKRGRKAGKPGAGETAVPAVTVPPLKGEDTVPAAPAKTTTAAAAKPIAAGKK